MPTARALRICVASPDVIGPIRNGGVGTACTALAQALANAGHTVTLFYTSESFESGDAGEWEDYYRQFGIEFVALPIGVEPPPHVNPTVFDSDPAERSYRVYMWLRTRAFDVIHFPDYGGLGYFTALAKRQGLHFERTVICSTAHSPTLWSRLSNAAPINDMPILLRDRMEQGTVAASDLLISPSRYMIKWMQEQGWSLPARQVVLPNLLPVANRESSVRTPDDENVLLPRKVTEIVFFGRIEPRKGLLIFCDAIDRIVGELDPDITLTFLGKTLDGEYGKGLLGARFTKWQLRWQVIDDLNTFEAREYLAGEGRLAVIPSLADNSPYTVLECLTWKVPFLASRIGGVAELIHPDDNARVLFEPTPPGLAAKLKAVLAEGMVPARLAFSHEENLAGHLQLHSGPMAELVAELPVPAEPATGDPPVTVCLLHHDRPAELAEAVASLERQTYRNIEVVLVDNGSVSAAAQAGLAAIEPKFAARQWQVVRLPENMYEPFARNQAARIGTGKYLLFMDDDNVAKEREVETFVRVAERTGVQVLTCFLDHFDTAAPPLHESQARKRFIPIGDAGPLGLLYNGYGDVNCFVEREAFLRIGGFVDDGCFNHAEDWRFLARACGAGLSMSVVPEALAWYRVSTQPSAASWRKRDRSGALMRAAAAYLEHAPKLVQPFLLLAQGLFWKAVEAEARVRELDRLYKAAEQRAGTLQSRLTDAERRYVEMLGEYRKLEMLLHHSTRQDTPEPASLARMRTAVAVGRRRHFGLTDPPPSPEEP